MWRGRARREDGFSLRLGPEFSILIHGTKPAENTYLIPETACFSPAHERAIRPSN